MPWSLQGWMVAGCVVVHAVDVGPYLYLGGVDGGSHQRGAVVAAAPAEVVDLAAGVGADESLRHVIGIRIDGHGGQRTTDAFRIDFLFAVGHHEIGRVEADGLHAAFVEVERENRRGEQFALCDDDPFRAVFLEGGRFASDRVERRTHALGRFFSVRCEQAVDTCGVFFGQHRQLPFDGFGIAVCRRCRYFYQSVRRARHGREHGDPRRLAPNDFRHSFHVAGRSDRSPSEFQYLNHKKRSISYKNDQ